KKKKKDNPIEVDEDTKLYTHPPNEKHHLYDKVFVLSFIIYNISTNLNIVNGIFYIQAKKDSITFEWKAKEQTRKLAIDSSKPCFEVVDIVK
ncbi:hypothetical protein SAO30_05180, partial [Streptococcus pneumoniae]|uniref:hypothetical protein n=1 Tax=Streptococcus pneumoniae TaxID=1313 RepID=UPI00296F9FAF